MAVSASSMELTMTTEVSGMRCLMAFTRSKPEAPGIWMSQRIRSMVSSSSTASAPATSSASRQR